MLCFSISTTDLCTTSGTYRAECLLTIPKMSQLNTAKFTKNLHSFIHINKLTNLQLQLITRKCGISLTGPSKKDRIINSINDSVIKSYKLRQKLKEATKIGECIQLLSIDTGLRNFSFCRMEVELNDTQQFTNPKIQQWYKMDLNQWSGNMNNEFTPQNFSSMINKLIFELIYNENDKKLKSPDVILIERQRFRTMGNHNVFEHVLKSNVLENMLISSLHTANLLKPKVYNAHVENTSPLVMSSFWTNYVKENSVLRESFKPELLLDKNSKDLRVELVDNWIHHLILNSVTPVELRDLDSESSHHVPQVELSDYLVSRLKIDQKNQNMLHAKNKRSVISSSRRLHETMNYLNSLNANNLKVYLNNDQVESGEGNEITRKKEVVKGDDLADSLLHGLSWINFENNKYNFFNFILEYEKELERAGNKELVTVDSIKSSRNSISTGSNFINLLDIDRGFGLGLAV